MPQTPTNTLFDQTRFAAEAAAAKDFYRNLPMNAERYGALPGSAWDTWYTKAYKALQAAHPQQS